MIVDAPEKDPTVRSDAAPSADPNANPFFSYKNYSALNAAKLNAQKFQPFIGANDTVLESGAKGGFTLAQINAAAKAAIEIDPAGREACKGNGLEAFGSLADLPAGRRFSRIISHHYLEHLPYPIQELRQLREHLTDDGKLVINVPIDDWREQGDWTVAHDHHLHTWTPPLLANTLAQAGFEVERVWVLSHAWPPMWQKLMYMLPQGLFDAICKTWAFMRKRHQLMAVAHKRSVAA